MLKVAWVDTWLIGADKAGGGGRGGGGGPPGAEVGNLISQVGTGRVGLHEGGGGGV